MTSSERRVTSGKVWNKEDDRRERSEKAERGRRGARNRLIPSPVPRRQFVLDLVLSPRSSLSFAREREVKPGSFFSIWGIHPSSPPCRRSVARFVSYESRVRGDVESWDQRGETFHPSHPLPTSPLPPPLCPRGPTRRHIARLTLRHRGH